MPKTVDEFLAKCTPAEPGRTPRCTTCNTPKIARATAEFLNRRESGVTTMAFKHFYDRYLVAELGCVISLRAVKDHVNLCLGYSAQGTRLPVADG